MDKRLDLSKKGHDVDDNATKFPQARLILTNRHLMCKKENMMGLFVIEKNHCKTFIAKIIIRG